MPEDQLCETACLAFECEARFQRNFAALLEVAPEVAEAVRQTTLVVTFLARSRDRSIACRLETADGERRWVGGTVVPFWAADQMVRSLDLPPVGHLFLAPFDGGHNVNALLAATHEHQHLFVLERNLELFAGTLLASDVSHALLSGRVHLLVGPHLGRQIAAFFAQHPACPAPEHLVTTSTEPETVAFYKREVSLAEQLLSGGEREEAA